MVDGFINDLQHKDTATRRAISFVQRNDEQITCGGFSRASWVCILPALNKEVMSSFSLVTESLSKDMSVTLVLFNT